MPTPGDAAFISVGMPVFNGNPEHLDVAVRSIVEQNHQDFEFLIVDDGSTSAAVSSRIDEWRKADARIRVWHRPNSGLTPSLNFLLNEARGSYFARMDADDESLPERLSLQSAYLAKHAEVELLGTWSELIDNRGGIIRQVKTVTEHADIVRALRRRSNPITHSSVMLRTSTVRRLGGYDERLGGSEDYELWMRVASHSVVHVLPEFLHRYRVTASSDSFVNAERHGWTLWLAWRMWRLRSQSVENAYELAESELRRWRRYYTRRFLAEALRSRASRLRLLRHKQAARSLLLGAMRTAPWNVVYPALWVATFVRP